MIIFWRHRYNVGFRYMAGSYFNPIVAIVASAVINPNDPVLFVTDFERAAAQLVFVAKHDDATATPVKSVQQGGTKVLSLPDPAGATRVKVVQ